MPWVSAHMTREKEMIDGWRKKEQRKREKESEWGSVMKMEERWVKEESDGGKECERWIGTLGIKINCRRK